MAARDVDQLRSALELARRFAYVPTTARLSVEAGQLSKDASLADEGRTALVEMGEATGALQPDLEVPLQAGFIVSDRAAPAP